MKKYLYPILGLLFVAGVVWLIVTPGRVKVGIYDDFAKCIKSAGVTFYGAFWCSHCQAQKARFGTATQYLPYVECSNADGQTQNKLCNDAGITTYPTWQFGTSTASRILGEMELTELAEKTSCVLPKQ